MCLLNLSEGLERFKENYKKKKRLRRVPVCVCVCLIDGRVFVCECRARVSSSLNPLLTAEIMTLIYQMRHTKKLSSL